MKKILRLWTVALPLAAHAQFADFELSAPTLSYALGGSSGQLLPIQGVPGAAILGSPLHLNASFSRVWVSTNRRWAAAASADGLSLVKLNGTAGALTMLGGVEPSALGFSPQARWMALSRNGNIELWGNLPDRPSLVRTWPAPDAGADRLTVSEDGSIVVALSAGRLLRLGAGESPTTLDGDGIADVTFSADSQTLFGADRAGNRILSWNKVSESTGFTVVAGQADGIADPVALSLSADERLLAVLTGRNILLLDLASGRSQSVDLNGLAADGLRRATGNAVFQLNTPAKDGIWLLDADSAAPRLFPVAGREEE